MFFNKKVPTLPVYKAEIDPDISSDVEVNYIGLVDRPAIERNFQAFKNHQQRLKFVVNEERQIISGPAMIADMLLYRSDKKLGEYYVVFDKKAIKTIVEKFSAKGFMKNFNLFHDPDQKVTDVTIFNSFVTDSSIGILPPKGFEDTAEGSWFISAQINDNKIWQRVKSGEIKGFSVEGLFEYRTDGEASMASKTTLAHMRSLIEKCDRNENWEETFSELLDLSAKSIQSDAGIKKAKAILKRPCDGKEYDTLSDIVFIAIAELESK